MVWVWILLGFVVVMLVVTVAYGFWLYRMATELWSEIAMLGTRAEELQALLEKLELAPDTEAARARLQPRELVVVPENRQRFGNASTSSADIIQPVAENG